MANAAAPAASSSATAANLPANLLVGLMLFSAIHRGRLALAVPSDGSEAEGPAWRLALGHAWQDAALALAIALLAWGIGWLTARAIRHRGVRLTLGLLLALPMLAAIGANCQTHLRTIAALHSGVTWSLLKETLDAGEMGGVLTQAAWGDLLGVTLPVIAVMVSLAIFRHWPRMAWPAGLGAALVLTGGSLQLGQAAPPRLPAEVNASPVVFTASDFAAHWGDREDDDADDEPAPTTLASHHRSAAGGVAMGADTTETADESSGNSNAPPPAGEALRLVAPEYVAQAQVERKLPAKAEKPWNIVWIVMESTGRRYLQGDSPKGLQPMPFLVDDLAKRGWWLAQHRSPSNSSATSIFAQMSGLYPSPTTKMFSVQKDVHLPTLFTFVGDSYERFLVTPGKLSFFFPRHFLRNSGLQEMHGYDELRQIPAMTSENAVRNEIDTVSFFLGRLKKAKPPFAAVYYSFAPHWEYLDYGPKYRRFSGGRAGDPKNNRMYLLDTQIKRIVQQLQDDGLLDSTILVLASDHGEAFGQHEHNYAHSRASFEENYSAAGVLVQPKLFPPQVIDRPTSHIDLLPTVLDALGVAYNDALLQGESLFQSAHRRKYQFLWGNENTVSALRNDGLKVQLAVGEQKCWAFDLSRDPKERSRLACGAYAKDLAVLKEYRERQRKMLPAYSAAHKRGEAFAGQQHPGLRSATIAQDPEP
jgi:hypothetical protein